MKKLKIKSKLFLSFIVIFAGYYLYSYHSENTKYEILNEIFSDMDYNFENICINKTLLHHDEEQLDEFNILDKPSVYSQYYLQYLFGTFSNFRDWEVNKIKPQKIKFIDDNGKFQYSTILKECSVEFKEEKNDKFIKLIYTNPPNMSISLPILSANANTAIIQITNNCGMLCGSSNSYLFKKIKGKWTLVKQNMSWIS
jgi:hypothetical protein